MLFFCFGYLLIFYFSKNKDKREKKEIVFFFKDIFLFFFALIDFQLIFSPYDIISMYHSRAFFSRVPTF